MSLARKTALVTGASMGLGLAFTRHMLARGASVGMLDISAVDGEAASSALNAQYGANRTKFVRCDVTHKDALKEAFGLVSASLGPLDIVFNNAGVTGKGLSDYNRVIDINLTAVIAGTALAIEHMQGRGGAIVNVASLAGFIPAPLDPVYAATKSAVLHFSRSLANLASGSEKIRVNALCPGFADTALVAAVKDLISDSIAAHGRLLTVEEVADAGMRLVEDETLAGQALLVHPKFGAFFSPYHPKLMFGYQPVTPSKL